MQGDEFKTSVYKLVSQIPKGRVATYGDIAAAAGRPRAARQVGMIAHFGPQNIPWHRVVSRYGGLARGYPGGGKYAHREMLENDGVEVDEDFRVDIYNLRWSYDE